jgi:translation initiation factor IF-2
MSKKDLLERLARASSDGRTTVRRPVDTDGTMGARADSTRTRVSNRVIRRRRRKVPTPEAPPPTVEPVVAEAPVVVETIEAPPVEVVVKSAEDVVPPPPVEEVAETPPTPEPVEPPPEETPEVVEAVESLPVVEEEPKVVEEAPAPPEPKAEPTPVVEEPVKPAAKEPPKPKDDDAPRYVGLGKAVVMPPPGYDPTNPGAYRRKVQAAAAATVERKKPEPRVNPRSRRRVEASAGKQDRPQPQRRVRRNRGFEGGRVKSRRRRSSGPKVASPQPKAIKRKVKVNNVISVAELAQQMGVKATLVIRNLMGMGSMVTVNEMLDMETAGIIAKDFDYTVENVGFQETNFLQHIDANEEEVGLESRPPIITVMGHVDHGKTTLLDAIRNTKVVAGEAGGITQHIGAYQVEWNGNLLTFLDTPGHAAFTGMRARGAEVTDIVVLVVAVDDGVQPQTEEAISHAKAANVPIVVAINKIDKPGVNPDAIKNRLSEHGLTPEEWGGETLCVPVSALRGDGIDELLEALLLQSEMLALRANPTRHAEGVVIESKMERGRGAVATLLVHSGTLHRGDFVVIGGAHGRVRAMLDHRGKKLKIAPPSTPVEVFGLSLLPDVGDVVSVVKTEKNARKLADHRNIEMRQASMVNTRRRTAEDLFATAEQPDNEVLHIVLKTDVSGTLQALRASIEAIDVEGTEVRILHAGVGNISESDVSLIAANGGILLGFNVKVDAKARSAADQLGVKPVLHNVIYSTLDYVEARMKGLLAPVYEEVRQGSAEVRATFDISRIGRVAGCYVVDGKVSRNSTVRVMRNTRELHRGKVATLRRFKDPVREVAAGLECGISLDGYNEMDVEDIIEFFALVEVGRS